MRRKLLVLAWVIGLMTMFMWATVTCSTFAACSTMLAISISSLVGGTMFIRHAERNKVESRRQRIFRPSADFTSQEVADNWLEFTAAILHDAFRTVVIRQQLLAEARAMGDSDGVAWFERQLEQAQEIATQYKQSFWRLYNDAKDCGLSVRPPKYQYYVRIQIRVREDMAA